MNETEKDASLLTRLADNVGGKIEEVVGPLPDGSGFATMTLPLPEDHWIYGNDGQIVEEPPAPFRMGTGPLRNAVAAVIRDAGRYAVKASTQFGKEMDFDPDAMLQNLVVGFLGYWTRDGFSHINDDITKENANG